MNAKYVVGTLVAGGLLVFEPVWACEGQADQATSKVVRSKGPKSEKSVGSSETRSERAARLKRECKGLPNAGVCYGYAS